MDLIVLVYGDPWAPDLPAEATVRSGLARPFIIASLALLLVLSSRRPSADPGSVQLQGGVGSSAAPCGARTLPC